jgi:2',3'-cyclic-nucleotide 2'-phosphodiesterase (5'-nucleotidase family)
VRLTIFHDTHTHGNFQGAGGVTFAHYVGLMRRLQGELPAPGHSLFLGTGQDLSASPMAALSDGRHAVETLNASRIDATTLGGRDLQQGLTRVQELVALARFPVVSANVRDARTGQPFAAGAGVRPWVIKDVGGLRVGITGLYPPGTPDEPGVGVRTGTTVRVFDPVEAMREVVPQM